MAQETKTQDAISILKNQHEQIKSLFAAVESATGEARQEEFDHLRALLAVHETAEEMVLRPVTRKDVPGGEEIAEARMAEENEAKKALAELEKMDVDSPQFISALRELKTDVIAHAQNEEHQEFPGLQSARTPDQLVEMGRRIERVEKMAPTHPHPSAKTTTANYLMGPFAAMVDRVRDAMKKD
jgi:hemerythrin superfamily protein